MVKDIYEGQKFPDAVLPSCPIEKKLKGQTAIVPGLVYIITMKE